VPTSCSAFHLYQLRWTPDAITIGVDGRAYFQVANDHDGDRGAWPFDRPFHLILNLAMGGGWPGPVDDAALPQAMQVDYVRVWSPALTTRPACSPAKAGAQRACGSTRPDRF
jgi:beta-glucanase (GH16 family)